MRILKSLCVGTECARWWYSKNTIDLYKVEEDWVTVLLLKVYGDQTMELQGRKMYLTMYVELWTALHGTSSS
jgi:hypothetical protein